MRVRPVQVLVLSLLFGCGDDAPSTPNDPLLTDDQVKALAEPIVVQIDPIAVAAAPNTLPMLSWKVTGPFTGLTVEVRAHPPRESALPALAALTPGSLMPGVEAKVLASMPVAATGQLALTLPEPTEGAWAFDVELHDDTSQVVAFDSRIVLVSSTPTLRLAVDRVAAAPTQAIQASVTLAAGAKPRPVRALATGTAPDDSVHTLALENVGPVFDAMGENVKLPVMSGVLTMVGVHRLDVQLFDAVTGEALAAGHAEITVCDQLTPTTVTVRPANTPASGVAVRFIDAGSAHPVASGTTDAEGRVTALLPAGSYVALTDELSTGEVITVRGCGAPTIGNGDVSVAARRRAPGHSNAQGESQIRAHVLLVKGPGVTFSGFDLLSNHLATAISNSMPRVFATTNTDLQALLNHATLRQALGGDEDTASELQGLIGSQATIFLSAARISDIYVVGLAVVMAENTSIPRVILTMRPAEFESGAALTIPDRLLGLFQATNNTSVNQYISDHLTRPQIPLVNLHPPAMDTFAAGSTQTIQANLVDVDNPLIPMADKPLTLVHLGQRITANTDANGTATFTFQVPSTFDPRPIELSAEYQHRTGPTRSNSQFYKVEDVAGRLRVFTGSARVRPGSNLAIGAQVRKLDGTPESGVSVTLTINLGGLATVVTEVTGVDGLVGTTAPVGRGEGLGVIEARIAPDVRGQAYVMVASGAALRLTTNTLAVVTGVIVGIDGVATREGAPIAGQHVDLTVTGGGTLSATSAVCDTHGRFHVDWTAPAGTGIATIHVSTTIDGDGVSADQQLAYRPVPPATFPADTGRWIVSYTSNQPCGDVLRGTTVMVGARLPSEGFAGGIGSRELDGIGTSSGTPFPAFDAAFTFTEVRPGGPVFTYSIAQAADFTLSGTFRVTELTCGEGPPTQTLLNTFAGVRIE